MDIMRQSIIDFPNQFLWNPKIENRNRLKLKRNIIIAGMGGSALPGELLKLLLPSRTIMIHRNYELPREANAKNTLVIAVSYSGNTEETIDAFQTARKQKNQVAVVTTGGKLLRLAKSSRIPYIQLTDSRVQPRMALGFMLKALTVMLREKKLTRDLTKIELKSKKLEGRGRKLARMLIRHVPIVYTSGKNAVLALMWKIKFNETGKIPAFWNVLPELNHNEMTGYDSNQKTRDLSQNFSFLFLADKRDDPRIQKRMRVLERILKSKRLSMSIIPFDGGSFESLFATILLGDWTAYSIAKQSNANPNAVPLVERFKKLMA